MSSKTQSDLQFGGFVAVDWADQRHAYAWCSAQEPAQVQIGTFEQSPEGIEQFVQQLQERFGGQAVALVLEQKEGPLVYGLMGRPWLRLYPINPMQAAKFRQALHPSGAKSDPSDSRMLLAYLLSHRQQLRPLAETDPQSLLLSRL